VKNCGECGQLPAQDEGCDPPCICCALCNGCSQIAIRSLIEQALDLVDKDEPDPA
jgi:hypothetical protein